MESSSCNVYVSFSNLKCLNCPYSSSQLYSLSEGQVEHFKLESDMCESRDLLSVHFNAEIWWRCKLPWKYRVGVLSPENSSLEVTCKRDNSLERLGVIFSLFDLTWFYMEPQIFFIIFFRLWTRKEKEIAIVTHSGFLFHTLSSFGNDCHPLVKSEIGKQ